MNKNTARDKAEDLLANLQRRSREWLDAEEGLASTAKALVEDYDLSPMEVRRRLEELMGRIKAKKVWDRISASDRVTALSDYRDEVERRVEDAVGKVVETLPVTTKPDFLAMQKQLKSLTRKVSDLQTRLKKLEN